MKRHLLVSMDEYFPHMHHVVSTATIDAIMALRDGFLLSSAQLEDNLRETVNGFMRAHEE